MIDASQDRAVDHDLTKIAISPSRDRAVNCDLAKKVRSRSRRRSRSRIAIDGAVVGLDLGCGLCFSGFVFSFFFSKHQKIFSGKFFEMQPNTWKHFPFSEISISGKYVFFGKHFTATKHSLRMWEEGAPRYYIPEISHNYSLVYPIVYQILKTFFFRF